ncbi:LTA synthase family protein [Burkholderia stabilis]|uniref:Capsular biosynthesis protein n=1 Tax=Burkholderia stabilis TaxID=95485 RepID=A0A1Y1BJ24_9BURK|nr:LTA synthase family protein [Burkholderia stabilis]BAX59881.1 capsular biosynthesis protein [Burkholderia stabilis]
MPSGFAFAAVAVALSFLVEAIAYPRASPIRAPSAVALHVAAFSVVAGATFAVTARPLCSVAVALVLIALLAVISNAKYESLREPFVFTDLSLFSQVFSHPRLYLPFLSVGKVLGIVAAVAVAVAGFWLEQPVGMRARGTAALIAAICVPACFVLSRRMPLTLDPMTDQRWTGFFAAIVAYLVNGLRHAERDAFVRAVDAGPFSQGRPDDRPDVIVIQSESYFDARRLGDCVMSGPYRNLDRARSDAFEYGGLSVPAWGANTMRSEFAMLTGLPSDALGYSRFYPYMYVRRACASLAGWFKRGGYRTLAVHPYHADFFGRNRAFRYMHFDRFLDIRDFGHAERVGPYIGDGSVADAVIALLQERDDQPLFAFAITMENHGPLHLESVGPGESESRHTLGDDARWSDLTAYLRHVENADRMIGTLIDYLRKRERPTVLCFYGDHVPAMTSVFDSLEAEPTHSDYFIWRNFGNDLGERRDVRVEALGAAIQRAMMHVDCIRAGSPNELLQTPA